MWKRVILSLTASAVTLGCTDNTVQEQSQLADVLPARESPSSDARDSAADVWSMALQRRDFAWPRDHAAHDDFRIEWWYYTGNVTSDDGHRFGYQLTFFRTGINRSTENPSLWAVQDLYTAHFALADVTQGEHHAFQRNSRQGIGLAGAETKRYRVWNGDWSATLAGAHHRLVAGEAAMALDLTLQPTKPAVLHGDGGLSQKGAAEGNASYYYSHVRMATTGTITVAGKRFAVSGESWMDHEFSTSFLEQGQAGWDWFAVQLDNREELMLYQIRREDGRSDRFSSGTWIDVEGNAATLNPADFVLTAQDFWQSKETDGKYPLEWLIEIPPLGYRLQVSPAFAAQEMVTKASTGISYWEGSIVVEGEKEGRPVSGRGYLELTGYTGQSLGSLFQSAQPD